MSSFLIRHQLRAGALYRHGRARVIWIHGVLCFGGPLLVLFNVVDYFFDKGDPFRPTDLFRLAAFLVLSILLGYLYGRLTWRSLDRTFGTGSSQQHVQ